jgi:L-serine/L-threonine ammonia-lyase
MIEKLKSIGAEVIQVGEHWAAADQYMREELIAKDKEGVYVPPFDHEHLWEGHSSIVDEMERQMRESGGYDAVICSIGGGGLFAGIMGGLEKYGRLKGSRSVKVLAVETEGARSMALSLERGELSRLDVITTIANSLGATQVAPKAFEYAKSYPGNVSSVVLSDAEAAIGSVCFADDERVIVEAACGVSIATAYNGIIRRKLGEGCSEEAYAKKNVVIVVCGGSNVTLGVLEKYRETYRNDEKVVEGFAKRWRL